MTSPGTARNRAVPECGLLNIPEGYRRQVWELVDSGKWFFSGPFSFFRKRPPGWWWALDRPDDLRRALASLAWHGALTLLIVLTLTTAAFSVALETTNQYVAYNVSDPSASPVATSDQIYLWGWARSDVVKQLEWDEIFRPDRRFTVATTQRIIVSPSWKGLPSGLGFALWMVLIWACPTFVGLTTQIRKGLPAFARPRRTILAAGIYESHRLTWMSAAFGLALAAWTYLKLVDVSGTEWLAFPVTIVTLAYAALGWVGPLRSDYTKQLIRSRFHAARIVVMYALLFPFLLAGALALLVRVLTNGR